MPHKWTPKASDKEHFALIKFLIEKTKEVKSPLNIDELVLEFKETIGSSRDLGLLYARINELRYKIFGMQQVKEDTKVKIMFALGTNIDKNYLEKLKENADVTLDDRNRIIEYKKKNGGLELKGTHGIVTNETCPRSQFRPYIQQFGSPILAPKNRPQISQLKFLETMQSLVLALDTSSLSEIQQKLENKIALKQQNNKPIENEELTVAMDFLMVKLTKYSKLGNKEESIGLRDVFLVLRTVILTSKLQGMEEVLEKLRKKIGQTEYKEKKVPVEKLASTLQTTLDIVIF